jgi:hypothetical protein
MRSWTTPRHRTPDRCPEKSPPSSPARRDGGPIPSTLGWVGVDFLPDGILDQPPAPSQNGATHVDGVDVNKPRARAGRRARLAVGPDRFTVADLAATVRSSTGQDGNDYTVRPSVRPRSAQRVVEIVPHQDVPGSLVSPAAWTPDWVCGPGPERGRRVRPGASAGRRACACRAARRTVRHPQAGRPG